MDLNKPNNKLVNAYLEHFWCMDEPQANTDEPRANTNSQNSPRPNLKEATTFPLIIFFVFGHGASTQMSFCPEIPK